VTHRRFAGYLFAALVAIVLADGSFVTANGAKPNVWLSIAVLEHHALTFAPAEEPFMFTASGREKYYLVPSAVPGRFVGTFGIGAGLVALPAMAAVRLVAGDLRAQPWLLWATARVVAAACVAASAAFVFMTAVRFTSRARATCIALAYGLGGAAWSIASQALYQHGPNMLFLSAGALCLSYIEEHRSNASTASALAGLALGAASWVRPTSVVAVVAVGCWLAIARRRKSAWYALGASVPLLLLASYQWRYLGSPWETGQDVRAASIALHKTGNADPWQTPFGLGLAGLMISPSRGLLVFSPWFVLAVPGTIATFRDVRFAWLRPLAAAAAVMVLLACRWFDWWGGWTYGYRPIVDATPWLALLTLPIVDAVFARRWRQGVVAVLVVWSIAVQALGAFVYDTNGWNAHGGRDIDDPRWRARLWSVGDSEILYYVANASSARAARIRNVMHFVTHPED
jgi:hypothetical protein